MSCCAKRRYNCDDAILDRLNGVGNTETAGRDHCRESKWQVDNVGLLSDQNGSCWQNWEICRRSQRSICDYCWLSSRCPYRERYDLRD